jgi:hypothetical protein
MSTAVLAFFISASVRLINDNKLWACADKFASPPVGLNIVNGSDSERINLIQRLPDTALALQPPDRSGQHQFGPYMEFVVQLSLPLFSQMWRAENGQPLAFASVDQLAGYQQCLNCFTNADVICDQQPNRVKLEGHQKRDKLVWPGFNSDLAETAERPGA